LFLRLVLGRDEESDGKLREAAAKLGHGQQLRRCSPIGDVGVRAGGKKRKTRETSVDIA
jgi:hypothetical protein